VSGVEQVARAGQVVFCDCLMSRGEYQRQDGQNIDIRGAA
jgi:hypothetical protein